MPAFAKFVFKDAKGNLVEWTPPETPMSRFQQSLSYDDYQKLSQLERRFALHTVLTASLNPEAKLDAAKKVHVQNILSQHFYTLPPDFAKEITDHALWISFIGDTPGLTEAMLKKFASTYPKERTEELCKMVRTSVTMSLLKGDPSMKEFLQLPDYVLQKFSSMVSSDKSLTDDKCALSKNDKEPLSLKQMVQEINKKNAKTEARPTVANSLPTAPQTVCDASEIKGVFVEAIDKIEKNGPNHKVYLGVGTMKCPIYGVVVRVANKQYRFFPNSYREDSAPAISFTSAEDIVNKVKPPEPPPQPEEKRVRPVSPFGAVR